MKLVNLNLDGPGGNAGFNIAGLIANGANTDVLRTNDTLRKDEWKALDTAVIAAAQKRLRVVADIRSRGLQYNLQNAMGTTILEYETSSDMNGADVSMDGVTRGNNDAITFELAGLPIPIAHKAFHISARKLASSRKVGQALDTLQASLATFKVTEAIEQMTVTGSGGLTYGGYSIYGLENHPSVNTGSLTAAWTVAATRDPVKDVNAMIQACVDDRKYGPFGLIIPVGYQTAINEDYLANYPKTVKARLMELEGLEVLRVSDHATSSKVTLFQLSEDTVRMVIGQDPTPVEWRSGDQMVMYFKVMSIMVPQVRADGDGRCGIAVYSA